MALKKREAKPESNSKPSLTIPARTRSPIEAFRMLNAGQDIDVVAGYYDKDGTLPKDFHLMDKIEKLSLLSDLRQRKIQAKAEYDQIINHFNQQKQIQDEQAKQNNQITQDPGPGGQVPQPGPTTGPSK